MQTNINVFIVLGILFIHYVADFILQDEDWAVNKSKSNYILFKHVFVYSLFWFFTMFWFNGVCGKGIFPSLVTALEFSSVTFVCHFATDYLTSRRTSKLFAEKKYGSPIPNLGAFSMIGFDQILHYLQLFITFQLINTINF